MPYALIAALIAVLLWFAVLLRSFRPHPRHDLIFNLMNALPLAGDEESGEPLAARHKIAV